MNHMITLFFTNWRNQKKKEVELALAGDSNENMTMEI